MTYKGMIIKEAAPGAVPSSTSGTGNKGMIIKEAAPGGGAFEYLRHRK
jgi:hypothetical protein